MSLLLSRLSKLRLEEATLLTRSCFRLLSNGFSSSMFPACSIARAEPCGEDLGKLVIRIDNEYCDTYLEKKVPLELMNRTVTVGASHGWVATLKEDGIVRLQDDLNPVASDTNPKRIALPPLVTLPHCQTEVVTNVAMSTSSPEDKDCVVAVKFLGPQLSLCRPSQFKWTNIMIKNPCFFSSRVMFSEKDGMFRMPGSGGHLIGSWDRFGKQHKFQRLQFKNLPELTKAKRELLCSCSVSEHLVESRTTDETFLVKWFRKAKRKCLSKMKTRGVMVFKLDEQGKAVYTRDIGELNIFISKSEAFCLPAGSIPSNFVELLDFDEMTNVCLDGYFIGPGNFTSMAPYFIPPQNKI
ncbi:hypothetical protein Rs2_18284 [Raphanus sativus]|uniref:Uncharacterized protein LOC108851084 n=1 Tax=Raphanus sativus TaxID=3726 RepID=A0A9W3DKH3_RAPSA|nr:uncharacterized protein LOC108851084 [Raphanus sativus]KAJ4904333.1 hypothetical protein Rs2_18284 [Raphanus sativus]